MLLWPVSAAYGRAAAWKMARAPRFRPPVPVVCVGNFVVGGAGKTPTALVLARLARGRGLKPGYLTRATAASGKRAAPRRHREAHRGRRRRTEPLLLAAAAPTMVSADRVAGAKSLIALGVDIIIMDDGFQNPSSPRTCRWSASMPPSASATAW